MICKKCGASVADNAEVCGTCGCSLAEEAVNTTTESNGGQAPVSVIYPSLAKAVKQKKSYKKIITLIVSLVVVLGIIASALALIIPNITLITTVGKIKEVLETGDVDILYEELMPPFIMDMMEDSAEENDQDFDEMYEEMLDDSEESWGEFRDHLEEELGGNIEYSFRVTDIDIGDEEDIKDYIDVYKDFYKDYKKKTYIKKYKITDYVIIDLDLTASGDKNEMSDNMSFHMIKIDGEWYLDFYGLIS